MRMHADGGRRPRAVLHRPRLAVAGQPAWWRRNAEAQAPYARSSRSSRRVFPRSAGMPEAHGQPDDPAADSVLPRRRWRPVTRPGSRRCLRRGASAIIAPGAMLATYLMPGASLLGCRPRRLTAQLDRAMLGDSATPAVRPRGRHTRPAWHPGPGGEHLGVVGIEGEGRLSLLRSSPRPKARALVTLGGCGACSSSPAPDHGASQRRQCNRRRSRPDSHESCILPVQVPTQDTAILTRWSLGGQVEMHRPAQVSVAFRFVSEHVVELCNAGEFRTDVRNPRVRRDRGGETGSPSPSCRGPSRLSWQIMAVTVGAARQCRQLRNRRIGDAIVRGDARGFGRNQARRGAVAGGTVCPRAAL